MCRCSVVLMIIVLLDSPLNVCDATLVKFNLVSTNPFRLARSICPSCTPPPPLPPSTQSMCSMQPIDSSYCLLRMCRDALPPPTPLPCARYTPVPYARYTPVPYARYTPAVLYNVNTYVLLTAARAIPSYACPNGAAVRECIEYGIAQSHSQ